MSLSIRKSGMCSTRKPLPPGAAHTVLYLFCELLIRNMFCENYDAKLLKKMVNYGIVIYKKQYYAEIDHLYADKNLDIA